MALTDKNLIITPNIGSSNDPKIDFIGASAAVGPSTITATIYPTNNGTLSFDGTEGSLFSISNNLSTGSIFSVNPISGIPIIDVNADRTIALNPYGGNTGIGTTNPSQKLHVAGNLRVTGAIYDSNNSPGINNQVLKSTGVGVTWVSGSGSGVDADTLDGLSSTSFLRSDTTTTWSGSAGGIFQVQLPASASGANTGQVNTLQLYQNNAGTDAFLSFHVAGDYAAHFGLDGTTNDLFWGGWSVGAVKNRVWHSGNDGAGSGLDADLLDGLNSATANTVSTIVSRDASGNFSAGTITAALTGNASTATTLQTTRTIWGQNFNGGANVSGALTGATDITASGTIKGNQIVGGTGSAIGSAGLIVNGTIGNNDSQLIIKKPSQSAFSVLSWDGAVYLASNIYYNDSVWVQSAPTGNNNNQMLTFSPGTGVRWYASNNGSGSWNVASDLQLWSDAGVWQRPLSNTLTLNTSGTGLSGSTTFNNSGAATFTVTSNATNANTGSTIVARDASGNFTAGTITAALTGNATTATTLQTTRTIWGQNFNGGANVSGALTGATTGTFSSTVSATAYTSTVATGTAPFTVSSTTVVTNLNADLLDGLNSATANTASTIVARDASGNFTAGTITAALTGNASTATTATNQSGGTVSATTGAFSGVTDFTGGSSGVPAIRIKSSGTNWAEGFAVHPVTDNNFALAFFRTRALLTDTTNTWAIGNLGLGGSNNFGLLRNGLTGSAGIRADSLFDVTQAGVFRFGFTPTVGTNTVWHSGNDGTGSTLDADTVDGIQASSFYQMTNSPNTPGSTSGTVLSMGTNGSSYDFVQSHGGKPLNLNPIGNTVQIAGNTAWHSGNDGAGSGLDADLLDGLNSATANTASTIVARDASGNFSAGTITATSFSGSGASLTSLNASNLGSGTVPVLRLGDSGTRDATTFLRGDNTWATVTGGATVNNSPSGTYYPTMSSSVSGSFLTAFISSSVFTFTTSTGTLSAAVLASTVATGTAPLTVTSTTKVTNLNADLLDDLNAATTGANTIVRTDGSGNLAASGNVTAYSSDRRLKENFNHIESPIEKVQKLNGYTFDWNEKSKELGFIPKHEKNDIGLIAQEVEEVLPQATARAPFDLDENGESKSGENYLTIQYERLVPLLVEAIKDQQKQIDELKSQLNYYK
jgi:hypothetical protein